MGFEFSRPKSSSDSPLEYTQTTVILNFKRKTTRHIVTTIFILSYTAAYNGCF